MRQVFPTAESFPCLFFGVSVRLPLCLCWFWQAGSPGKLLSGKAQEEGDGSGGTGTPALLDFTGDKNGQADNMSALPFLQV